MKYSSFRPGSYGKYSNIDAEHRPYLFSVMQTRSQWSPNTYMPYLKEADDTHLSKDSLGQRLVYNDRHIICQNDAFVLRYNEGEEIIETVPVKQDENGTDKEDRIVLLKRFIGRLKGESQDSTVPEISEEGSEELKKRFNQAMIDIYTTAKRECGYTATRFLQMVSEIGGLAAAKQLICKPGGTDGFTTLWEHHRLDLSVEAAVLSPEYRALFTEEEQEICKKRLEQFGYL